MPGSLTLPEGMYGIYAELGVYLVEESGAKVSSDSLVGRLEKHIEREVESLTAGEFLTRIQGVAAQAEMKHVIAVEKDDVTIFASDQESEENWDAGFRAAMDAERVSGGTDSWWVLMSGWNGDLVQAGHHVQEEAHPRKSLDDSGDQGTAGGVGQAAR